MVSYDFAGKVVLITGASRGIGAGILEAFCRAGATCVLHYFDEPGGANLKDAEELASRLAASEGTGPIHLAAADVRSPEQVESLMKQVADQLGGLDVLVNNAGILKDRSIRKMTFNEWSDVLETNLDGVFFCCKYGAEAMRDGGRIVNIASIAGLFPFHGQANYAAAKAGVIALTKVLARELARRGITANAVAPGVIQTGMLGAIKPEVLADYQRQIPVGRLGRPEDVANAVLFFAAEESGYVTGQVLPVTGGWF
jgi:3-oxoacyl-[acyl-carrier protein] reductase